MDRYGIPVPVADCACGLRYLGEHLTRDGYDRFYNGIYRRMTWPTSKGPYTEAGQAKRLHRFQTFYGQIVTAWLGSVGAPAVATLLDAGGSTGVVASLVTRDWAVTPRLTSLDLATQELAVADPAIHRIHGYLEDPIPGGPYDAILCGETVEHLTNPVAALTHMRAVCRGWLFIDCLLHPLIKIDHPTVWTQKTLCRLLMKTGWRPRYLNTFAFSRVTRLLALAYPRP